MRILYVSWYFPPTNTIAARRTGKMVQRFLERGATVQVVTGVDAANTGLPEEIIRTVPFFDLDKAINPIDLLRRLKSPSKRTAQEDFQEAARERKVYRDNPVWKSLRNIYTHGVLFPDKHVGWGRHLRPALKQALETFKPDLVYVSAPPHSQVLHVSSVLKETNIPWVAEFRDLWADEPFPQAPLWRRKLDKLAERRALKSASAIVTVSEPWAEHYRKVYDKPAHTTMNGFDPKDFDFEVDTPAPSECLDIVYAGALYPGRRDPSPLFQAIQQASLSENDVKVVFYTDYNDVVKQLAQQFDVSNHVELHAPIDYQSILRRQKQADILLLLQWIDPRNDGNVPAKVFEQLALRRPVLGIGPLNGVPARLINERKAGLVATDPAIIAEYLKNQLETKKRDGHIETLPERAYLSLERDRQFDDLFGFLRKFVK